MKEFYLPSHGHGQLHCCQWEPEGAIRAIVQIVHGIAEYVERYDAFARYLNACGILVVGENHMGHGKSVGDDGVQGYFHGGWDCAVADTYALFQHTRDANPGIPYILFGHSMGSFMARTFLINYPNSGLKGCILSGTGWISLAVLDAGIAVCKLEALRHGAEGISPMVEKLMFGAYCKDIEQPQTPYDWISTIPENVQRYCADPLCGFSPTIGLARDMLGGMRFNERCRNLDKMIKTLPVLLVAGDCDPVGAMGKGVAQTKRAFEAAGMCNVTMKLYPGARHEILNDVVYDTVCADVRGWIDQIV